MAEAKPAVPKVYEAICAVMAEIGTEGIGKDRKNQQQNYQFRGIDDVLNALSPILARNKLLMLPRVIKREQIERESANNKALFYTSVDVEYDLVSALDGSKHTIAVPGEAMDSADKSTNKAMSAAYKYAAIQAFCIPTEGDNDADASHHEVMGQSERQQRQQVLEEAQQNMRDIANANILKKQVKSLTEVLMKAAKKGSAAFNAEWERNAGDTRKAIFNDKQQMAAFKKEMDAFDHAEGN